MGLGARWEGWKRCDLNLKRWHTSILAPIVNHRTIYHLSKRISYLFVLMCFWPSERVNKCKLWQSLGAFVSPHLFPFAILQYYCSLSEPKC
jgi:ABC-type uncharacterized transport system permease subunit